MGSDGLGLVPRGKGKRSRVRTKDETGNRFSSSPLPCPASFSPSVSLCSSKPGGLLLRPGSSLFFGAAADRKKKFSTVQVHSNEMQKAGDSTSRKTKNFASFFGEFLTAFLCPESSALLALELSYFSSTSSLRTTLWYILKYIYTLPTLSLSLHRFFCSLRGYESLRRVIRLFSLELRWPSPSKSRVESMTCFFRMYFNITFFSSVFIF